MKLKNKKIKKKMPRTKAIVGIEEIAGLMNSKGLRSARQQSPFFTMVVRDEWLVSFDYAIVIHSIHSMLKNSIHSIQKLMNGPSGNTPLRRASREQWFVRAKPADSELNGVRKEEECRVGGGGGCTLRSTSFLLCTCRSSSASSDSSTCRVDRAILIADCSISI